MSAWQWSSLLLARHPDITVLLALVLPLGTSALNALGHLLVKRYAWLAKVHDATRTVFPDPAGLIMKILAGKLGVRTWDGPSAQSSNTSETPTGSSPSKESPTP